MEDTEQNKQTDQEAKEQNEQTNQREDRFSRLMFGPFPSRQRENVLGKSEFSEFPPQQGLDFMQLMQDIDTLVSSFNQLKPLMKKFTSFVDLFKKS
ncbi:hypothetical protein [Thermaerobacillus caldiproteolyticus]|uniref:Uncharacterized protein n=1 Tax=Thermaerobacillus caldiproteolyticus TaxID=247480 RepID=A0A7V9Z6P3_9BACL|nr:hypothetical protein [Anoxybacillus caldiproteolyticus]MBA2874918.1 hypothetical protein [Anoxybacillus caldiproteolyticus]QPA31718.1 hypothetical protein ISX45_01510 [Anoxybacillus caldiproteolyticus]